MAEELAEEVAGGDVEVLADLGELDLGEYVAGPVAIVVEVAGVLVVDDDLLGGLGLRADPELVVLDTEKTALERVERLLPMSQPKRNELAKIAARLDRVRAGRPYYTSVRLFASANRSLIARDPQAAVVEAASAVESMGWETLRSLAEEDGKPAPSSRTAFRNVLLDHLLPRLGVSVREHGHRVGQIK